MAKSSEKRVQSLADKMLDLFDDLARLTCPKCHAAALEIETIMRSGVRIKCGGWDPSGDDDMCTYRCFALTTRSDELPAPDTTTPP